MDYQILYSDRKTLTLSLGKSGEVIVKAPRFVSKDKIDEFVSNHENWIETHRKMQQWRQKDWEELQTKDKRELYRKTKEAVEPFLRKYSALMGVSPLNIKVTSANHRFGSCSSRGTICFSYRLCLYPIEAVEYVVVHELSHLRFMNHGVLFWKEVAKYLPDYSEREKLLKGEAYHE